MGDYSLGIKELDTAIQNLKKGSNILLIGPSMSGKDVILYHIMYHGVMISEDAVITVTTRESATNILEWFKENKLDITLDRIGIIDCVSKTSGSTVEDNEYIRIAYGPVDLTGIGVKISQFFDNFLMKKKIPKIQLHINSLSTILMYSNIQTVFRFMHVFTRRVKAAGALGIFVIESGMHEEHTIAILKQLFDGIIEIKQENDTNYIRTVGLSSKPTPWIEYEIEGGKLRIK